MDFPAVLLYNKSTKALLNTNYGGYSMSIGTTIRKLRRERDMTQDALAEALGITAKAVSQWENGKTQPDLSLIQPLCHLFDVTADELLEININRKNEERDALLDRAHTLSKNGLKKEAREILFEGMKLYPNDYKVMDSYADATWYLLYTENMGADFPEEERASLKDECIRIYEKILDECTDDRLRHSAISCLCSYYAERGEDDRAYALANKMPIICQSREFLYSLISKGTEYRDCEKNLLHNGLIQFLVIRMANNYKLDDGTWMYTPDEQAALRDKTIALLALLFEDGDYFFYNDILRKMHMGQTRYYLKKGEPDRALVHLLHAADCTEADLAHIRKGKNVNTSLLFRGMEHYAQGIMTSSRDNDAAQMLRALEKTEFDPIREREEFTSVIQRMKRLAGPNEIPAG